MCLWLKIGLVGKAHGLRGHFFVSYRDELLDLPKGTPVRIGLVDFGFGSMRQQGKRLLLKVQGIEDRSAAESLLGKDVLVERRFLVGEEDETSFLWADIVGAVVQDRSGTKIGTVKNIANFGASDVMVVENGRGARLEIALVSDFVDLDSLAPGAVVSLAVDAATFEDLWYD